MVNVSSAIRREEKEWRKSYGEKKYKLYGKSSHQPGLFEGLVVLRLHQAIDLLCIDPVWTGMNFTKHQEEVLGLCMLV